MKFQLYPLLQSAYRTGHSTETALPKVHNDILLSMDKKRVTLLVLLDLSAALLLKRLESIALEYLGLPLAGLNHTPMEDLSAFDLTHGVPRGSCLGPLLHTIYASKLFEIVKAHLADVHACADDTQLYLSFKPDSEDNQTEAVDAVQECIEDIRAWMAAKQLKLNEDKLRSF